MLLGNIFYLKQLQNPVNKVANGPNKFGRIDGVAVLTRVFYKKMYLATFAIWSIFYFYFWGNLIKFLATYWNFKAL